MVAPNNRHISIGYALSHPKAQGLFRRCCLPVPGSACRIGRIGDGRAVDRCLVIESLPVHPRFARFLVIEFCKLGAFAGVVGAGFLLRGYWSKIVKFFRGDSGDIPNEDRDELDDA